MCNLQLVPSGMRLTMKKTLVIVRSLHLQGEKLHECAANNPLAEIFTADSAQLYARGVLLAAASLILNAAARDKVLSLQNEADLKLLTQINYNIENMNVII